MFRVARQSPEQWRGTIEAGTEVAMEVLRNRVCVDFFAFLSESF
jgi:hypothetical protein